MQALFLYLIICQPCCHGYPNLSREKKRKRGAGGEETPIITLSLCLLNLTNPFLRPCSLTLCLVSLTALLCGFVGSNYNTKYN